MLATLWHPFKDANCLQTTCGICHVPLQYHSVTVRSKENVSRALQCKKTCNYMTPVCMLLLATKTSACRSHLAGVVYVKGARPIFQNLVLYFI